MSKRKSCNLYLLYVLKWKWKKSSVVSNKLSDLSVWIISITDNNHIVTIRHFLFLGLALHRKNQLSFIQLKIFATIFLTFSIFIQTFSTFIIQADFFLNRSYIAENLCVNRDKPMMHCNGKCYLEKKLKDQEKQNQSPVSKAEKFDVQPFFIPESFSLKNTATVFKEQYFIKNEKTISSLPRSIFHPPFA